jgi:hypothetical protein
VTKGKRSKPCTGTAGGGGGSRLTWPRREWLSFFSTSRRSQFTASVNSTSAGVAPPKDAALSLNGTRVRAHLVSSAHATAPGLAVETMFRPSNSRHTALRQER